MDRLSKLQRFLLFALLDPEYQAKDQRSRNAEIYKLFFQCEDDEDPSIAQASLSRAYRRLESRGLIERVHRRWELTDGSRNLNHNGVVIAYLVAIELKEQQEPPRDKESIPEA